MSNVIFDFDGTIADSLPVVLELFYKWSKREPFTKTEIETLRNMPAREVIKSLGIPLWRVPSLLARGRKDFTKHIEEIEVFNGMPDTIKQLHDKGHKLFLMSSNSHHNVLEYLKLHNIDQCFNDIYGGASLFGKAPVMRRIIKGHYLKKSDCYSVGDETRDVDAAKKTGIISIAVTWGYNGQRILKEHQPDHLISKPEELLKLLK